MLNLYTHETVHQLRQAELEERQARAEQVREAVAARPRPTRARIAGGLVALARHLDPAATGLDREALIERPLGRQSA